MRKIKTIVPIMLVCIMLAGCNKVLSGAKNNISEVRQNIYIGQTDSIVASFMSGKREEDYVINGVSTPLIEFGVIAVSLQNVNVGYSKTGQYTLLHGDQNFSGTLQLNPFDNSYVADIGQIIDGDSMTITVTIGSFSDEVRLTKANTSWNIDHNEALKIACKCLKSDLKDWTKKGFDGEVYIKIIHDSKISDKDYFWYVSFVNTSGSQHSVIIDTNTGKILTKK